MNNSQTGQSCAPFLGSTTADFSLDGRYAIEMERGVLVSAHAISECGVVVDPNNYAQVSSLLHFLVPAEMRTQIVADLGKLRGPVH